MEMAAIPASKGTPEAGRVTRVPHW
jgi:hypothetical protein